MEDVPDGLVESKEAIIQGLRERYGVLDFEEKLKRYQEVRVPVLSVVDEHSLLVQDIVNAYVLGSYYAALTGACCLGERIFNTVIFRILVDFRSSPWFKKLYGKDERGGRINDWDMAIEVLLDWGVLDADTGVRFNKLARLRHESVHYHRKPRT